MQGVPLVVLANKQDLINALPAAEVWHCNRTLHACLSRPSADHHVVIVQRVSTSGVIH